MAQVVKYPPTRQETWVQSLAWEDPLEKGKATHSSILAWRIPWTVQSMGLQRVGQSDTTERLSLTQGVEGVASVTGTWWEWLISIQDVSRVALPEDARGTRTLSDVRHGSI